MKRILALVLLLPGAVHAASLSDFAWGARLGAPETNVLYVFDIPSAVYGGVVHADLADLRVFNGNGEEVPHQVRLPGLSNEIHPPVDITLFPLTSVPQNLREQATLDLNGVINALTPKLIAAESQPVAAYIFDLSQVTDVTDVLELEWVNVPAEGFVARVRVEASDDLVTWRTLAVNTAVGELAQGEYRIRRNQIDLPRQAPKYLRMTWSTDANAVRLSGARLLFHPESTPVSMERSTVAGTILAPGIYQFDTHGVRPVRCVEVALPESHRLIPARLTSSPTEDGPWTTRHEGLFYDLRPQGMLLRNRAVCVDPIPHRFWRLEITESGHDLGSGRPRLEMTWAPHRLVFIARGPGPFTLAWGSTRVDASARPLDPVLDDVPQQGGSLVVRPAAVSDPWVLGGQKALEANRAARWWTIGSVLAILVLIIIVVRSRRPRKRHQDLLL